MKTVLGLDCGYGDFKVTFGDARGVISTIYKFNSVLGRVALSEHAQDNRVYTFRDKTYYVGPLALNLESNKIIDLLDYKNLERYSPLLVKYVIDEIKTVPNVIVCGLSIAHIGQSAYFKEALVKYLIEELNLPIESIHIIPQGIGGKICFDKYGANFPVLTTEFSDNANYVGCDIGFNTLDVFQVLNNKTTPNLIRGIENQGVVRIVHKLLDAIKVKHGQVFSVKEGKEILDRGTFKVRGVTFDMAEAIKAIKSDYLQEIRAIIENEFGHVLDKVDKIRCFGGGSYFFKDVDDPFVEIPKQRAEYYNSVGNYVRGCQIIEGSVKT